MGLCTPVVTFAVFQQVRGTETALRVCQREHIRMLPGTRKEGLHGGMKCLGADFGCVG